MLTCKEYNDFACAVALEMLKALLTPRPGMGQFSLSQIEDVKNSIPAEACKLADIMSKEISMRGVAAETGLVPQPAKHDY